MSKIVPAAVVALALVTIGIVAWSMSLVPSTILSSEPSDALGPTPAAGVATVTIEDGDGAKNIAEELQEAGVIQSARLFRVLVAFMGIENELQAGDYEFDKGMTTLAVIDRIHNGVTAPLMVTVPEGLRVEEIADLLDEKGAVSKSDFLAAVEGEHPESFLPGGASDSNLQGYLFPATYGFSRSATGQQAVQQMLDAFDKQVVAEVQPQLETTGLTLDQVITPGVDRRAGGGQAGGAAADRQRLPEPHEGRHRAAGRPDGPVRPRRTTRRTSRRYGYWKQGAFAGRPRSRLALQHVQERGPAARAHRLPRPRLDPGGAAARAHQLFLLRRQGRRQPCLRGDAGGAPPERAALPALASRQLRSAVDRSGNRAMKRVGLIGHPIAHSLSPAIQNAAFAHHGREERYELWDTEASELEARVRELRGDGFLGANVTVPYKQAVMPYLDRLDPLAEQTGAVNTIVNEGGRLAGHNTDVTGFAQALSAAGFSTQGERAVVLGAGGAARAVGLVLVRRAGGVHRPLRHRRRTRARRWRSTCASLSEGRDGSARSCSVGRRLSRGRHELLGFW